MRRDTREKISVNADEVVSKLEELLEDIQKSLFEKALKYREENSYKVDSYDEFKDIVENRGGFIYSHWCGNGECELSIKEETKATIRCIPEDSPQEEGKCIYCGNPSERRVIFARNY